MRYLAVLLALLVASGCAGEEAVEPGRAPAEKATQKQKPKQKKQKREKKQKQKENQPQERAPGAVVAAIVDGDTLEVADGRRVRLLQIDTPELGEGECYSRKSAAALHALAPPGSRVRLVPDPRLDRVDRYGRVLRYVFRGRTNVNLELVRRGAASVWFYDGDRGRYAAALLTAATRAKAEGRGLWRACPGTALDPFRSLTTLAGRAPAPPPAARPAGACDPSYPDACIPPPPPDLDCADVDGPFAVRGPDPHGFDGDGDGDGDGVACE